MNYDAERSVYSLLKETNSAIRKMPSLAQIVFNAAKILINSMDLEIGNFISIIFENDSVSNFVPEFKVAVDAAVEYFDEDTQKPKRWLTAKPAIDIMAKYWMKLKISFACMQEENQVAVDATIQSILLNNEGQTKVYLEFLSFMLTLFESAQKELLKESASIIDVHATMQMLKTRLEYRISDNCYGEVVNDMLVKLKGDGKQKCLHIFAECTDAALNYLQDNYDFERDSIGAKLVQLNLSADRYNEVTLPSIQVLQSLVNELSVPDINKFDLGTEIECHSTLSVDDGFGQLSAVDKWCAILSVAGNNLPELGKFIQFIMSIPVSLEFVERMVQMIAEKDEMNREKEPSLELFNSEVLIAMNTDKQWKQCRDKFLKGEKNFNEAWAVVKDQG